MNPFDLIIGQPNRRSSEHLRKDALKLLAMTFPIVGLMLIRSGAIRRLREGRASAGNGQRRCAASTPSVERWKDGRRCPRRWLLLSEASSQGERCQGATSNRRGNAQRQSRPLCSFRFVGRGMRSPSPSTCSGACHLCGSRPDGWYRRHRSRQRAARPREVRSGQQSRLRGGVAPK